MAKNKPKRPTVAKDSRRNAKKANDQGAGLSPTHRTAQQRVAGRYDGIWDWDLLSNQVYFSPRWKEILGHEDHEILNHYQEWESRLHPEDRARVLSQLTDYLERRSLRYQVEFRLRKKNGEYCWVQARGKAMWDAGGRPYRMAGSHTEITDHKQEDALRAAEKQALELVVKQKSLERASQDQADRLRLARDIAGIAIWDWNILTNEVIWSENCEEVKGLPRGSFDGTFEAYQRLVHPEDLPRLHANIEGALSGQQPYRTEHRIVPPTGEVQWVEGNGVVYRDESDRPIRMVGTVRNITEQKRIEQALRVSQKRYARATEVGRVGVWELDVSSGTYYGDKNLKAMFGYQPDELSADPFVWLNLVHPDDQSIAMAHWQRVVTRETEEYNYELRMIRKDGTVLWTEVRGHAVRGGDGQVTHLIGATLDITARKQSEAYLRRTQFAMDQAVDAVYWIDPQAKILYTNEAASVMLGYTKEEFLRMTVHDLNPDFPAEVWPGWWEEVREQQVVALETNHLTKAGRLVPIDIRVSFLAYGGQEFHCVFVRDISARKGAEEAAHRSFTLLQSVLHTTPIRVFWKDRESRFLGCNQNFAADAGCADAQEIVGKTDDDLIWRKQAALYQADDRLVMESGLAKLDFEEPGTTPEGKPIFLRTSKVPLRDERGSVIGVLGVYDDITERKRLDEALRESQERFELAARATNDGIWDWNILTGEQYWSDRHLELFGLEPHALTPTYATWISLLHPDDADRVHQATCRHLETRDPYDIEVRVRMKDGGYRWFRDRGHAVWDRTGRPVRMVGSLSDVTEQKHAEAAILQAHAELELRVDQRTAELAQANRLLQDEVAERKSVEEAVHESELRYKLLTEATFDGIAIHDQGVLLDVNAGLERMFGYGPGELIGRSLLDLVAEESRDLVLANMQNGVNGPYEAIGCRKDGTTFPGEVVVRPCCYRGKQVRLVAGRDITARKHLELEWSRHAEELERQVAERSAKIAKLETQRAQAEKLAAMGRLAAGVAHEINNPIAGIKNAFELVKQAVDPAHPHAEFTGMIDREITRVASIVQNMYQLYRPESGKGESVELQTMITDIKALFAKRLEQRRLLLAIDIDSRIRWLCVSRGDMLQVLLNLLHNAIDYSSEGGTITLTVREEAEVIRIAVSDQGAGIQPEDLPHIFDPFFTTKTGGDQKGMGLGLSISQSLVTAMGGTIEVQTHPNGGSTFSILLPRHTLVAGAQDQLNIIKEVVTHDY